MKRIILLLILTSNQALAGPQAPSLDDQIESYLRSITSSAREYQRVDDILGDTVLEGDSCDALVKGKLSKGCKAELKAQVAIERAL